MSENIKERISSFSSWIEVDLDCIKHNLFQIKKLIGNREIIPVVKANAYGHGIVPIVRFLIGEGIDTFLVAKLEEALSIRRAKLKCNVLNVEPIFSDNRFNTVVTENIIQVVFTLEIAERLSKAAKKTGSTARVYVKVDTGLGRVGIRYDVAVDFIKQIHKFPDLKIEGMFSTLTELKSFDEVQLKRLLDIDASLRKSGIEIPIKSISSSDALLSYPAAYLDAVRPGITIYGYYPSDEAENERKVDLKPALRLKGRIELVKWINAGESVSYSRAHMVDKRTKVATVHVGYSDGYSHLLSNKGSVLLNNNKVPIIGSVSVNHFMVDISGIDAKEGDEVLLIGGEGAVSANQVARLIGTSAYKIVNWLSPLLPRVYLKDGKPIELYSTVLA
jgi:alanine racemase